MPMFNLHQADAFSKEVAASARARRPHTTNFFIGSVPSLCSRWPGQRPNMGLILFRTPPILPGLPVGFYGKIFHGGKICRSDNASGRNPEPGGKKRRTGTAGRSIELHPELYQVARGHLEDGGVAA